MTTAIRVLCGNVGPRWSSVSKAAIARRKAPLIAAFKAVPSGVPAILILQECVADTQRLLMHEFGYEGYGNGIHSRGSTDKDRSGDNGVILWDPRYYTEGDTYVTSVGDGSTNTFVRVVTLTRSGNSVNVIVTHPPNSVVSETFRMHQVRELAAKIKDKGFDLENSVWGADWNSYAVYPHRGVRTLLEQEFKLRDIERVLSADAFAGNSTNSANHFKPTRHDGKKIDAIVIGSKISATSGSVYRTDSPPQEAWSCDHNWIIGDLRIG